LEILNRITGVIKLGNSVGTIENNIASISKQIDVFPNPNSGAFYFNGLEKNDIVSIYNLRGELIDYSVCLDVDRLFILNQAKGVYLYKVSSSNKKEKSGRIIIQ
jgi:hypothetical protein